MNSNDRASRRRFLQHSAFALGGSAAMCMLPTFAPVGRALAATLPPASGYKASVCIFLFGGNDSFNMLIPYVSAEYDAYNKIRGGVYDAGNKFGLAYSQASLLRSKDINGKSWGINPDSGAQHLPKLFDAGELAFIANVGTLAERIDDKDKLGSSRLPPFLYSHSDQQRLWMRGHSDARNTAYGWGGLCADKLRNRDAVNLKELSPSISIAGNNLFQTGQFTFAYSMGKDGPVGLNRASRGNNASLSRRRAVMDLMNPAVEYQSLLQSHYGLLGESSIALQDALASEFQNDDDIKSFFLHDGVMSSLGEQLCMIARSIRAARRPSLNHHRQIYFAGMGGFDTHDSQMVVHGALLFQLAQAMTDFRNALAYISALNDTVTFTMSDFGRTLNSNGNGTDHGWGGVQMVMSGSAANGGPLLGRRIWGDYPLLSLDNRLVIDRGRVIPTTSNDQMAATIAKWMGIDASDLGLIFPDINNKFDSPTLGFLG